MYIHMQLKVRKDILSKAMAFFMCLISISSNLINYIIPIKILRALLIVVCFVIEIYYIIVTKWKKREINILIYTMLLALFPLISIDMGGAYSVLYYICSLMVIILILADKWKVSFSLKFMYIVYGFYSVCTILFFFMPGFYKEVIVNLFPEEKDRLLALYNNGCMAGLTSHYSINGMFLATGFLMACTHLMNFSSKKADKRKGYIKVVFFLIALLLTGKRAHLIFSIFSVYIVYCIRTVVKGKKIFNILFKIVSAIFVSAVIGTILLSVVPALSTAIVRLQQSIAEGDIDNGRYVIWKMAFRIFKQKPVLGIGWKKFSTSYGYGLLAPGRAYDTHNVYLQLLCETGMVGFCCYVLWFITLLKKGICQLRLVMADGFSTQNECYAICFAVGYQIFFLVYCITGNPLYEKITFFPYFISCGIILYFEPGNSIVSKWDMLSLIRRKDQHEQGKGTS